MFYWAASTHPSAQPPLICVSHLQHLTAPSRHYVLAPSGALCGRPLGHLPAASLRHSAGALCATSQATSGALRRRPLGHFAGALCATCHSAVLPARGSPLLEPMPPRGKMAAEGLCSKRHNIRSGSLRVRVADCARSLHHMIASAQRCSCKSSGTPRNYNLLIICTIKITSVADGINLASSGTI